MKCSMHYVFVTGFMVSTFMCTQTIAEPQHAIAIDGTFTDWANVPTYYDPANDEHDTDHHLVAEIDDVNDDYDPEQYGQPAHVDHDDVDLLEFKLTHDEGNMYAYFKATGEIGLTQADPPKAGRYYAIVTIDVDNDDATGYELHQGGYFPTTSGYDINFEVEYYDGVYNTGHYLQHGCMNDSEKTAAFLDQEMGLIDIRVGTYKYYTQWVWWDDPNTGDITIDEDYADGTHVDASITWVEDKGAAYHGVIVEVAKSVSGDEIEIKAPFRGFMKEFYTEENIMQLGKIIDVSFSLEASGELAAGGEWASDTADPIIGYFLSALTYAEDLDQDDLGDSWESTNGVHDPGANEDGDEFDNLEEFLEGFDPNSDDIWVDFSTGGTENGSRENPWNTFGEGLFDVSVNGTIHIQAGTTVETQNINKAMTLLAEGGTVRLGE